MAFPKLHPIQHVCFQGFQECCHLSSQTCALCSRQCKVQLTVHGGYLHSFCLEYITGVSVVTGFSLSVCQRQTDCVVKINITWPECVGISRFYLIDHSHCNYSRGDTNTVSSNTHTHTQMQIQTVILKAAVHICCMLVLFSVNF